VAIAHKIRAFLFARATAALLKPCRSISACSHRLNESVLPWQFFKTARALQLIVLVGFEVERAAEVITQYEPSSLSIGLGKKNQSISDGHHDNNKYFEVIIISL
jgi:hypothetical protein